MSFNYYTILNNSWKKTENIRGGVLFIIEWFIKKFWKKKFENFSREGYVREIIIGRKRIFYIQYYLLPLLVYQ